MARRRAAAKDVCPLEGKTSRTDEDTSVGSLEGEPAAQRSSEDQQEEEGTPGSGGDTRARSFTQA